MTGKKWGFILTTILLVSSLPANAQIVMNMGGSSSSVGFAAQLPLALFQRHSVSPVTHYVSPDGMRQTWTGMLLSNGQPAVIRYEATNAAGLSEAKNSADGIKRLQYQGNETRAGTLLSDPAIIPMDDSRKFLTYVNETSPTCSGSGVSVDRNGDGVTDYIEFTGCTGTISEGVHLGISDVDGSSFGQAGPLGMSAPKLSQDHLINNQKAIVPFKFVVGVGVKKIAGGALVPVENLTRVQVEAMFGPASAMGGTRDWRQFGLVPDVDGNGVDDGGAAPVTLCVRKAGSGAKAALDQLIMLNGIEIGTSSSVVIFNKSAADEVSCVKSHPLSIGYVNADLLPNDPSDPNFVNNAGVVTVKLDGLRPYDHTVRQACGLPFSYDFLNALGSSAARPECDPRAHLLDGRYYFWTALNLNSRPNGADPTHITPNQEALISAFINAAGDPATIAALPAGKYWVAVSQMCVTKNIDKGPITWKSATSAPAYCPAFRGAGN